MSRECTSAAKYKEGDIIKGYKIEKVFDPGAMAYASKAIAPSGRPVFFKKYKMPGGDTPWLQGFIDYQNELKRRVAGDSLTRELCYEFIEFFDRSKTIGSDSLKAFYQVFEWVEGGSDLRKVLDKLKSDPAAYDWGQRTAFARVMVAGIFAIHKAGVIHTDLKPENFYLVPAPKIVFKWKIRVIDMDWSLLEGKRAPWHGQEGYVTTPGYSSPEHLNGGVPERASDVFTLGLIIGELLGAGHPAAKSPGGIDNYNELVLNGKLSSIEIQQPLEKVADIDFLNHVVNACFRLDATSRPTAEQLLRALNGNLNEFDGKSPSGTPEHITVKIEDKKAEVKKAEVKKAEVKKVEVKKAEVKKVEVKKVEVKKAEVKKVEVKKILGTSVELQGPSGAVVSAGIATKFGRNHFKAWGVDYEKFMSPEQFHVFRDSSGNWMIEHCYYAKNATNADGIPISSPALVRDGMLLNLGKTGKCPITLRLI